MPIFPLTEKYRLASDFNSWELQERKKRKHRKTGNPVEVWKAIKWYRSTETALDAAYEHCLRVSDTGDICKLSVKLKASWQASDKPWRTS